MKILSLCLAIMLSGCAAEKPAHDARVDMCGGTCGDVEGDLPDGSYSDAESSKLDTNPSVQPACPEPAPQKPIMLPEACSDTGGLQRFVRWEGTGLEMNFSPPLKGLVGRGDDVPGVALFDADGDGDLDAMVGTQAASLRLFLNDGTGSFSDHTVAAGLEGIVGATGLSIADFDGDGDRDAIAGRVAWGAAVLLNDGTGRFEPSPSWQVGQPDDILSSGSFNDFDDDGDLDFYVGNYGAREEVVPRNSPNRLYRNDGSSFTELVPGPVDSMARTLAVAWWDFDADGRDDIWVVNDFGMYQVPNQLIGNTGPDPDDPTGWSFEDVSATSNLDAAVFGMTATLGDFDNDGDRDAYVSNIGNNLLFVWADGQVSEEAVERGVTSGLIPDPRPRPLTEPDYSVPVPELEAFFDDYTDPTSGMYGLTSWTSIFFDADQDGWLDLFVANGNVGSNGWVAANQPNYLFLNQRNGTFARTPCYAIPDIRGSSRTAATGDLDGDGDLDLVWIDNGISGDAGIVVVRNEMATGNWLTVVLHGAAPNTDAIGAKVTLETGCGTQTRWIDGGQTSFSVSERVAHFGLGEQTEVRSLTVEWPDGTSEEVIVGGINARLHITQ